MPWSSNTITTWRASRTSRGSGASDHLFECEHESVRAFASMTESLHLRVEPVHELESGQMQVHAPRFLERKAHVLDEVIDHEAGIEVTRENARRQIVERPAGGRATPDRLQHRLHIESRAFRVE